MKLFTTIFAFVMIFYSSMQRTEKKEVTGKTITVTVPNVTSNKGTVNFALFTKEGFMISPKQSKSSLVKNKKSTIAFTNVAAGEYAIICFHDVNANKKMDFNENRMPIEDYGVSNNPFSYGPPNFEEAKFTVANKNVTLEIKF